MIHLRRIAFLFLVPLVAALHCKKTNENSEPPGAVTLKDSVVVSGLNHPWEILWGPDDHIWMTERNGRISRINPATWNVNALLTVADVSASGEGGLLGMVLHPNFTIVPHVFVVYNYNSGSNYREKIVRYTYNGNSLVNPLIIFDNIAAAGIHNGSRLLITNDLKLLVTTGDAANQSLPQNKNSVNGKILRLNLDGSTPSDNPVAGNPYWSLGHRNAQGMVIAGDRLFISEHGPTTDDEINFIEKGRNYGWPDVHGFCDGSAESNFCTSNNVAEPLKAWTPTVAVCGMDYYNSNLIPQWKNSLLVVALKNARLYQLKLNDDKSEIVMTNEYLANAYGRMRDICISPAGRVYICTSNGGNNDRIIEIRPE